MLLYFTIQVSNNIINFSPICCLLLLAKLLLVIYLYHICITDAKGGLKSVAQVEALRDKVYAVLEEYCKQNYPDEPGRFAKLLLRLPALRSIGLKCLEHLFFFKLIGDTPIDDFLLSLLEAPSDS